MGRQTPQLAPLLHRWGEQLLFNPTPLHYPVIGALVPLSLLYCGVATLQLLRPRRTPPIPTISVGNLVVGGAGKTPFTIGLVRWLEERWRVGVVSRGYRRRSRGVLVVANNRQQLVPTQIAGDEPVEIGEQISGPVVVAESRWEGLQKLRQLGVEIGVLDDGFRHPIRKVELLLDPAPRNRLCLPAGPYRFPRPLLRWADLHLREGVHFHRRITPQTGEVLVAGISRPERLLRFAKVEQVHFFPDHHRYTREEVAQWAGKRVVTTRKDWVKLRELGAEELGIEGAVIGVEVELTPLFKRQLLQLLYRRFPELQ